MRLSQLRYAVAVHDHGGFTRAADACHIAQSSVSQAISSLERELGVSLFERQGRTVRATPAGEHLVHRARALLEESDDIARETRRIGSDDELTLRIGFVGGVRHEILDAMGRFAETYPEVTPVIVGGDYRQQTERLVAGEIDLAIYERREDLPERFVTYEIAELPSWVELSTRDPLAAHGGVTIADLRGKPLVITSSAENREVERTYFREVLGYPDDFVYVGSRDESVTLVVGMRGYEQCGHVPGHETFHPGLTKVALVGEDGRQLHRPLVAVWLAERSGYYVEEFACALRQSFMSELAGTEWEALQD
ncbi:MAG: LysR family transcriptional regulator [Acidobacteriota bacterium]|nr:LysR family transcriptional regulator [Acidobacteriota bacterium]